MARLGDICKFQSGGTPSKSNPNFFGGNIPWITTVALNGGIIDSTNAVDWITDKAIQESVSGGIFLIFTALNKLISFLGSEDRENDLYERFYKQNKSTIS